MFEPISPEPPALPPSPPLGAPRAGSNGRALQLLHEVRRAQRRSLWAQGILYGLPAAMLIAFAGALSGKAVILVLAGFVGVGVALFFGAYLSRKRVGDDARTARRLAELAPGLHLDLLAAVELSKALGAPNDFSPELAKAFLRDIDAVAARQDPRKLVSPTPVQQASTVAILGVILIGALSVWQTNRLRIGLAKALEAAPAAAHLKREPITGDFELTYRYPAYTGLESRTVAGTSGELAGPAGTEVDVKTRADRDIDAASLIIGDQRAPLVVKGRDLTGSVVLDKSGSYHVAFLDGAAVVAEGPELPIQVQADAAPQVRLTAPVDVLELGPEQQSVTLKFEASDDFGLTTLDLVFKPQGGTEQIITLKPDDGRTTRGQYQWSIGAIGIKPGGQVSYYLRAQDNDTVTGPKRGVSRTQTITLYSASEHRREALRKTQALWERLVLHLADRMEAPERAGVTADLSAKQSQPVDERGVLLASDFRSLSAGLMKERDPFEAIISALINTGAELQKDESAIAVHRKLYARLLGREGDEASRTAPPKDPVYVRAVVARLTDNLNRDREHSEKNVLYLESLIDRVKLEALQDLAKDLKDDRRELSKLLEEFSRTKDPQVQQRVLQQMNELKRHMMELQRRMNELAKGIRDDFMNREALQEMMESENFDSKLDDIEQLVKDGKADEALKKMQELSMQMDEQLEQLEKASDEADEQADPELTKKFQEFGENLEQTAKQQESLAGKTKAIRDRYREQTKDRIAKQGAALKRELQQKLNELQQSYEKVDAERSSPRLEESRLQALRDINNVKQSLEASDFDLASEAADKLQERSRRLADAANDQKRLDDMFQNPPEVRRESKQLNERLNNDAKKAEDIAAQLKDLFPQNSSLSEADRQQMGEMSKQQRTLEQKADLLQQQMDELSERAPIFDEDAKQQMKSAGQRMGQATQKLSGRDPQHSYGEQQSALQSLRQLQQQMQRGGGNGGGKKGGLPMPMRQGGTGRGRDTSQEKVEIPDEDPNRAPREFRKDVMDAMKQGAPDRYRDQNKRYYEELVK